MASFTQVCSWPSLSLNCMFLPFWFISNVKTKLYPIQNKTYRSLFDVSEFYNPHHVHVCLALLIIDVFALWIYFSISGFAPFVLYFSFCILVQWPCISLSTSLNGSLFTSSYTQEKPFYCRNVQTWSNSYLTYANLNEYMRV